MNRKQFDQQLFDTNDIPARVAVIEYLTGMYVVENEDKYGPDLVAYYGFKPAYYIEVEVKHNWQKSAQFPFPTIQLPQRKEKFTKLDLPVEFWILRADLKAAMIIPDYVLSSSSLVEVPNRYVSEGEMFFQVPIENCILVEL